jgi:CHAD domain-containing protein
MPGARRVLVIQEARYEIEIFDLDLPGPHVSMVIRCRFCRSELGRMRCDVRQYQASVDEARRQSDRAEQHACVGRGGTA